MNSKLAWRNLWRNKRRTFITAASVFLAVILAVAMQSVQHGVYQNMINNVAGYYTGYIQIHGKGYWDEQTLDNSMVWSDSLASTILSHPEIVAFTPRVESFMLAAGERNTKGAMVVGTDPLLEDSLTDFSSKIIKGKYFQSGPPAAILGSKLAERLKVEVGDTIVLIGQGYHGNSAAGKYAVQGIARFGSPELNSRMLYLPLEEAQRLFTMPGLVTSVAINLENNDDARGISKSIAASLDTASYEVMPWQELMPELQQTIEADYAGGLIMQGILYLVVSFGIFGTMLMMISERMREFGMVVAIGMKRGRLAMVFFLEMLFIAFMGALAGMIGAMPLILYLHYNPIQLGGDVEKMYEQFNMEAVIQAAIEPKVFIINTIIVFGVTIFLSIYPMVRLLRLNVIEALRN